MSIPASHIVAVDSRVINAGGSSFELNGMFVTDNALIPPNLGVLQFSDPDSVSSFFGASSPEADAAARYFAGFDNSTKKPSRLYFGRRIAEDSAPYLRGSAVNASLADFKAITNGFISLELGGKAAVLQGIDLSGVSSLSGVAQALQSAIRLHEEGGAAYSGATVVYDSLYKGFMLTSGSAGLGQSISPATGDIAEIMKLTELAGVIAADGASALTYAENLDYIAAKTRNWFSLVTILPASDEEAKEIAEWVNSQGLRFAYPYYSMAAALSVPGGTSDLGTYWQELKPYGVFGNYGELKLAAAIAGWFASVDYGAESGAISFAFKRQAGQEVTVNNASLANALLEKGFNFYGDYATANDQFLWYYPGKMFNDDYDTLDIYANAVWLGDALQVANMSLLANTPRITYDNGSYTAIRAASLDVIRAAKENGVITAGISLSEAQKAQINREAGLDIANTLWQDGYYLQVSDPGPSVRAKHGSPKINLWYTHGNGVLKLDITKTAVK